MAKELTPLRVEDFLKAHPEIGADMQITLSETRVYRMRAAQQQLADIVSESTGKLAQFVIDRSISHLIDLLTAAEVRGILLYAESNPLDIDWSGLPYPS